MTPNDARKRLAEHFRAEAEAIEDAMAIPAIARQCVGCGQETWCSPCEVCLKITAEALEENARLREFVQSVRQRVAEKCSTQDCHDLALIDKMEGRAKLDYHEAVKSRCCRICGGPDSAPLVLDYGREYAHRACIAALESPVMEEGK
jgi:hypothetical protein